MTVRLKGVSMITKEQLNELHDLAMRCGGRVVICFNNDKTKTYRFLKKDPDWYREEFTSTELENFFEGLREESQKVKPFTVGITDEQEKKLFSLADSFPPCENSGDGRYHVFFYIGRTWIDRGFIISDDTYYQVNVDQSLLSIFSLGYFDLFVEEGKKLAKELAVLYAKS
jgi:hypothetical protein